MFAVRTTMTMITVNSAEFDPVLGTVLSTLHTVMHLILITILQGGLLLLCPLHRPGT